MPDDSVAYDEPADEIVKKATAARVTFSKDQLGDWHRAGLIPKPQTQHPGGGGSKSVYPRGTLRQAIACAQLMARLNSVERVGWILWLNRFSVREDVWRQQLVKAHAMFVALHETGIKNEEFTDELENALYEIAGRKRLRKPLGQVRRRLKQSEFKQALALILAVATGPLPLGDDDEARRDEDLINRLIGYAPAAKKKKIASAPLLPDSAARFLARLEQMSGEVPRLGDPKLLHRYVAHDFCVARDEFSLLVRGYRKIRKLEKETTKRLAADARFLEEIIAASKPVGEAGLILVWLVCRQIPEWRRGFNSLVSNIRAQVGKR